MSNNKEKIRVTDSKGFIHEVVLDHSPHHGFSTAYDERDRIIGQVWLGRIHQPIGDDDREWEMYEQLYAEWTDEIKSNMIPLCKNYFDSKYH